MVGDDCLRIFAAHPKLRHRRPQMSPIRPETSREQVHLCSLMKSVHPRLIQMPLRRASFVYLRVPCG